MQKRELLKKFVEGKNANPDAFKQPDFQWALIEAQKKIESFFMKRDKNIDRYGKPEVIACNRLRERKQFLNDYFLSEVL